MMGDMTGSYPGLERPPMHEFVEDLCARDPRAARTRMVLLRLERQAHSHGWSHRDTPMIFELTHNTRTHHVTYRKSTAFQAIVVDILRRSDLAVGEAFQVLAEHVEKMERGEFDKHLPPSLREMLMSIMKIKSPDGTEFYGYAARHEAWAAPDDGVDCRPSLRTDRIELRGVHFAARDGLFWQVIRIRGEQPRVLVDQPGNEDASVGDVANALSRLTRVFANNPVPIIPPN